MRDSTKATQDSDAEPKVGDSFTLSGWGNPSPARTAPPNSPPLLQTGEIIRMSPGGPPYRVEQVSEMRAFCIPLKRAGASAGSVDSDMDDDGPAQKRKGVNISARSLVERVRVEDLKELKAQHVNTNAREPRKESTMAVAAMPVGEKSNRQANKEAKSRMEARKRADRDSGIGQRKGTGNLAKAKAAKAPKTVRKCYCGCGEETTSYFAPGHDARWHGWVKKLASGVLKPADLTSQQKKSLGDLKKAGQGYVPVLNYNGEKYVGH